MTENKINPKFKTFGYYVLFGIGIVLALFLILGSEKESNKNLQTSVSADQSISAEERQVKYLLEEMEDVESVSVMLKTDDAGKITGIAVICENGESPVLQEKIIRLLKALYGLGSHQIAVSG